MNRRLSTILRPLDCPLWLAEWPRINALSGLWADNMRRDVTSNAL